MKMGKLIALYPAAVIVYLALALPMAIGDDVTLTAIVVCEAPEVLSVSVNPDPVMIYPCPATTQIIATTTVFHPNGVDMIGRVEITAISPAIAGVDLPIMMTSEREGDTEGTYIAAVDLPSCTPHGVYTLEVTATDKSGNDDTGSTEFFVEATIALRATDLNFGIITPGGSSTTLTTVTCTGNVELEFVDMPPSGYNNPHYDGLLWSDMTAGKNSISGDNLKTSWNSTDTILCCESALVEFTLTIPPGTAAETYTGILTFTQKLKDKREK